MDLDVGLLFVPFKTLKSCSHTLNVKVQGEHQNCYYNMQLLPLSLPPECDPSHVSISTEPLGKEIRNTKLLYMLC